MAEQQFTSRRARREAERLKAEQAFEARDTPDQPSVETAARRAELLTPTPVKEPEGPTSQVVQDSSARPSAGTAEAEAGNLRAPIDAEPAPRIAHERGALATDHPLEERPPVNAEDRLDPQRTPLPHFESRAARKRYLREHGLSLEGDLSTGAMPVVAEPEETDSPGTHEASTEVPAQPTAEPPEVAETSAGASKQLQTPVKAKPSGEPEYVPARDAEPESYDTAGFGGAAEEVAARDFESPVTADSRPKPVASEDEPYDALSKPLSDLDSQDRSVRSLTTAEITGHDQAQASETSAPEAPATPAPMAAESPAPEAPAKDTTPEPESRSRRMPIVQPPSTSGVRVVTAASAQIPEADADRSSETPTQTAPDTGTTVRTDDVLRESGTPRNQAPASVEPDSEASPDDAARALAANPETRPMDTVPEAWALPNANYEDEETENPPGERIRASAVTGHDGRILVGEEPSKVPYIALGVAATVAVALIVIALVMLL